MGNFYSSEVSFTLPTLTENRSVDIVVFLNSRARPFQFYDEKNKTWNPSSPVDVRSLFQLENRLPYGSRTEVMVIIDD